MRPNISIICKTPLLELFRYFFGCLTAYYLDIFSHVSQSVIPVFYRTSRGEFTRYSVARLTVNYLSILSGIQKWNSFFFIGFLIWLFSTFSWTSHCEIYSIFCRTSHNELPRYSSPSIIRLIKSRKMRLARHMARMGEERFMQVFGGETWGKETTFKT
jgi:hypothetical protein